MADLKPDANAAITPPPGADLQPDAGAEITAPSGIARRVLGDGGIALAKGIIGVPEAAVGLADLASGGQAGRVLENQTGSFGFRPKQAKDFLDTLKSPEQQAADQKVAAAEGFFPTAGAMIQNPSTVVGSALESAPSMIGGAGIARGVLRVAPRVGAIAAGAIGEGGVSAGQNAEQVRQEDPNGTLTPMQSAVLAGSGALTGALGFGAGRVANKLGIGDIETMLAQGKLGVAAGAPAVEKGLVRRAAEGFATEGALQELPQSAQEQAAQNIAQGKPLMEGVGAAGAQGLLVGGVMGAGGAVVGGHGAAPAPETAIVPPSAPVAPPAPSGPFSKALLGLPAPVVTVGPDGTAQTADQRQTFAEARAARQGQIVESAVPPTPEGSAPLQLPAPAITVDAQGNASTVDERQALRDENGVDTSIAVQRGGIRERMRNRANQVVDTTAEPAAVTENRLDSLAPVDAVPSIGYDNADPVDRSIYDQVFGGPDNVTDVEAKTAPRATPEHNAALDEALDRDIPWDEPSNVDERKFLREFMGLTDEKEIDDVIAETNRRQEERRGSAAGTEAAPAGTEATSAANPQVAATSADAAVTPDASTSTGRTDVAAAGGRAEGNAAQTANPAAQGTEARAVDPTSGRPAASWALREKATGKVVAETTDPKKVAALNTEKYEAVQIGQHLAELSDPTSLAGRAARAPAASAVTANTAPTAAKPTLKDAKAKRAAAIAEANATEAKAAKAAAPKNALQVKRETKVAAAAREAEEARASHFTPGNIIRSSTGGFDRVVSYKAPGDDGRWSVTVHPTQQIDGKWVDDPKARDRTHATDPTKAELHTGPRVRAPKEEVKPAPLYSQRKVAPETAKAIADWAKSQGFKTVADDMHVTLAYSSKPVDARGVPLQTEPMNVGPSGRGIKQFDSGAVVLTLPDKGLADQHHALRDAGASWDYKQYEPHITLTYDKGDVDLKKVKPYRGPITLQGEERSLLDTDFKPEEKPTGATNGTDVLATPGNTPDNATGAGTGNPGARTTAAERVSAQVDTASAGTGERGPGRSTEGARTDVGSERGTVASGGPGRADERVGRTTDAERGSANPDAADRLDASRTADRATDDATGGRAGADRSGQGAGADNGVQNAAPLLSIDGVRSAWDAANIKGAISERNGAIVLSQIVVPEAARNQGAGRAAMKQLLDYADQTGQRVELTPSSDFGGNKLRLTKFYKGLGFKENTGRSRDLSTRETMIREPVTTTLDANARLDGETGPAQSIPVTTQPANANRSDKARELNRRLAVSMKGAIQEGDIEAVEPGAVGEGMSQMLAAVRTTAARLFGHDVVFVKFKDGVKPLFNGAVSGAIPGTVFIRIDSARPHMAVMGHELMHQLRTLDPRLYRQLDNRLQALYKDNASASYFDKIKEAYESKGLPVPKEWAEEMNADIVGDHFMEPQFWQDLAAKGPAGPFRMIANAVIRFLDRLKRLMTSSARPFGTEQYLNDLDAARAAVVDAMSQFSADQLADPNRKAVPAARSNLYSVNDTTENDGGPGEPMLSITADATPREWAAKGRQVFNDYMNVPGKVSFWSRTVGTPYHLAQTNKFFKPVFDTVQTFLADVSNYANTSSQLAPRLLPRLESLADIKKSPISSADNATLSKAVFDGTLNYSRDERGQPILMKDLLAQHDALTFEQKAQMLLRKAKITEGELKRYQALPIASYEGAIRNRFEQAFQQPGIAWKDSELKERYGMTGERKADGTATGQLGLHDEYRKALNKSLDDLSVSEMLRYAGKDASTIKQMAMDADDVNAAAELIRDHLMAQAEVDPAATDRLMDAANKAIEIADRATDLKARGYAPLSRFGEFTLDATTPDGERYFGMFETNRERMQMMRKLEALGATDIKIGTKNPEAYKLLRGMNPESAALFGDFLGLDEQGTSESDKAYQEFLKKAINGQSALRRMIARKGIAGFNDDSVRGLADFLVSNSRRTSTNLHAGDITKAVSDIPQGEGAIQGAAQRLASYVSEPKEEAGALRGLLFTNYIGGSIASALVNSTQVLQTTIPYLSQFGGAGKAAQRVFAAAKLAVKDSTGDPELDRVMALNADAISPQEIHQLQGVARGVAQLRAGDGTKAGDAAAFASNQVARLQVAWGKLFSTAEQFNRRTTFIAAYKTAIEQGMPQPVAFARKTIAETQFISNRGNRAPVARGAVGSVLFTFKSYSVAYLEMLQRMATAGEPGSPERRAGQKGVALALGSLMLMGGAGGLPFEDDIGDVIDAIAQRFGFNVNTKQKRQEFLEDLFGTAGGRFVDKGISGIGDMPLDLSGRMGMASLIPGTGLLTKKADYSRDVAELFGPAGDFAKRAFTAAGQVVEGNVGKAIIGVAPKAIGNVAQAMDMATTGMYKDQRGRKVVNTDGADALLKGIGFSPTSVSRVQEATSDAMNSIAQVRLESQAISDAWATGIATKDPEMVKDAQDRLKAWNSRNESTPIRPRLSDIQRKARVMMEDKVTRLEKSSPKAIRATVREQIAHDISQ